MSSKPVQKTKEQLRKLKELLETVTDLPKVKAIASAYNARCKSSEEGEISDDRISELIKYSCGEIYKKEGKYYAVGNVPNYNGLNGAAMVQLCKAQRDQRIFPNPFIYCINERTLMLEVKPKYADRAKHLLNKAFTKRYIYDIFLQGNQLIIFLLSEDEREDCNKNNGKKRCRTDKFDEIDLGDKKLSNPHLKKVKADQELTCVQIVQMLETVVEK